MPMDAAEKYVTISLTVHKDWLFWKSHDDVVKGLGQIAYQQSMLALGRYTPASHVEAKTVRKKDA